MILVLCELAVLVPDLMYKRFIPFSSELHYNIYLPAATEYSLDGNHV